MQCAVGYLCFFVRSSLLQPGFCCLRSIHFYRKVLYVETKPRRKLQALKITGSNSMTFPRKPVHNGNRQQKYQQGAVAAARCIFGSIGQFFPAAQHFLRHNCRIYSFHISAAAPNSLSDVFILQPPLHILPVNQSCAA